MNGVELIAAERLRQVERYNNGHDDRHKGGEIAYAAAAYAIPDDEVKRGSWLYKIIFNRSILFPLGWEFRPKRKGRIRELVKSGALIAAEIDRLQRAELKGGSSGE